MGYSFMHIEKIKSAGKLMGMHSHNYRTTRVFNADESQRNQNEELYSSMGGKTYYQAFTDRLAFLQEKYKDRTILPKNGVVAFDVITSMPRSDLEHVDLEQWKADQVKWIRETFNRDSKENGENVLSVVFHGDEAGSVHCHAVVLPIDNRGKFKGTEFIKTKFDLQKMQTEYGKAMEAHGLQRGLKGSVAKHEKIVKFYTELNQNLRTEDMPIMEEGEKQEDYEGRLRDYFENVKAGYLRKIKKRDRQIDEEKTKSSNAEKEHQAERKVLMDRLREYEEQLSKYDAMIEMLSNGDRSKFQDFIQATKQLELYIRYGDDNEKRQQLYDNYNEAIAWTKKHLNPALYNVEAHIKEKEKENSIHAI